MNAALTIRSDFTKPNLSGYVTPRINFQGPRGSTSVASYSIAVTNPSTGLYGLSGTDRNGSVSGNNVTVTIAAGDTITFNNSVHTNHPLRIRVSNGGADVFTPALLDKELQQLHGLQMLLVHITTSVPITLP